MNFIASQFRRHQSTGWKCIDRFGVGLSVDARPNSDISPSISLSTPVENSHNFFPTSVFLRTRGCSRGCSRARSSSYQQQNPHSRIARSFKSEEISVTVGILESREHRMARISHGASTPTKSLVQHLHTISLNAQTLNETGKTTTFNFSNSQTPTRVEDPKQQASASGHDIRTTTIDKLHGPAPAQDGPNVAQTISHIIMGDNGWKREEKRDRKKRRYRVERQDKREDWMRRTVRHCPASGYQSLPQTCTNVNELQKATRRGGHRANRCSARIIRGRSKASPFSSCRRLNSLPCLPLHDLALPPPPCFEFSVISSSKANSSFARRKAFSLSFCRRLMISRRAFIFNPPHPASVSCPCCSVVTSSKSEPHSSSCPPVRFPFPSPTKPVWDALVRIPDGSPSALNMTLALHTGLRHRRHPILQSSVHVCFSVVDVSCPNLLHRLGRHIHGRQIRHRLLRLLAQVPHAAAGAGLDGLDPFLPSRILRMSSNLACLEIFAGLRFPSLRHPLPVDTVHPPGFPLTTSLPHLSTHAL